jgi:dolichol kinase
VTAAAPSEGRRRALHLASGSLGLAALFLRNPYPLLSYVLLALLGAALIIEIVRRYSPAAQVAIERAALGAMRPVEHRSVTGSTWLLLGFLIAWLVFPPRAAALGMLVTSFADPAAAFIGILAARARGRKTLAGSAACLAVAFAIIALAGTPLPVALLAAAAATLAERLPGNGMDNVAMPIVTAAVLWSFP